VTTVLGQTGDKSGLESWRNHVGHAKADQIASEAADLGSIIHEHMESYVLNLERPSGTNLIYKLAKDMSDVLIDKGLSNLDELYGCEVSLYFPGLSAGSTDLIGIYKGREAILDFKNTRKMKKRNQIQDYFIQTSAYALFHDHLFGTDIKQCVILMVDRSNKFEEFIIEGNDLIDHKILFLKRLDEFNGKLLHQND